MSTDTVSTPSALPDAVPAGAAAYVVTVGADGRAHVVPARPTLADGAVLITGVGSRTRRSLAAGNVVTVLWSPADADGYTLIVDGSGEVSDDTLVVRPTRAVLHRSGSGPRAARDEGSTDGCVADCVELALD